MPSITDLLSRAVAALDGAWKLAAVPAVIALVPVGKYQRLATPADAYAGVSFVVPVPVTTSWGFLSLPAADGLTVAPENTGLALATAGVTALLAGGLGAGYLGSIDRLLAGDGRRFLADARRYLVPILGFEALVFAGVVAALLAAVAVPLLLFVLLPVLLVAGYLLYPVPYLVVIGDSGLRAALDRGLALTRGAGEPASFFVGYLLAAAVVSVPATVLFVNLGPVGGILGAVVLAPVGLAFDTATMAFVRDVTDDGPVPAITPIDG